MNKQLVQIRPSYQEYEYFYSLISRKRKKFQSLNKRFEKLSDEISAIQAEYDVRIGTVLRKISILDYEIEKHKAALSFMKKGLNKEEALEVAEKELKNQYKKESDDFWEYFEKEDNKEIISEDVTQLVRRLWKKLAQKYHPDLSDSSEEKKRREQIMKYINTAYAKKDFDALKALEDKDVGEVKKDSSTKDLEQVLVDIENASIRLNKAFDMLKKSEWYLWRKKSQEERNSHFADLEKNFMREMIRKEFALSDLKKAL